MNAWNIECTKPCEGFRSDGKIEISSLSHADGVQTRKECRKASVGFYGNFLIGNSMTKFPFCFLMRWTNFLRDREMFLVLESILMKLRLLQAWKTFSEFQSVLMSENDITAMRFPAYDQLQLRSPTSGSYLSKIFNLEFHIQVLHHQQNFPLQTSFRETNWR